MKETEFDYNKLRGRIKEICGAETVFAAKMNLSKQALSSRLNNKTDIPDTEIFKAKEILNISGEEIDKYFFTPKVQKLRT